MFRLKMLNDSKDDTFERFEMLKTGLRQDQNLRWPSFVWWEQVGQGDDLFISLHQIMSLFSAWLND